MVTNPFNPLDWVQSAQDWFTKTERSSGFRPYLVYLILCFGLAVCLLSFFSDKDLIIYAAICLIGISALAFIFVYIIKSFQDPNFCRSESHIQRMKKIDMEMLGTESKQVDAQVVEQDLLKHSVHDTKALEKPPKRESSK